MTHDPMLYIVWGTTILGGGAALVGLGMITYWMIKGEF